MSVCDTVSLLAREIEQQLSDISESQLKMIRALKDMPKYSKDRRLDLWEEAYKNAINDDEEKAENFFIIDLIFELGASNLYGAFNESGTYTYYRKMIEQLSKKGFGISKNMDVSKW